MLQLRQILFPHYIISSRVDRQLAMMYNKYMSIDEMVLREEIAKAIESLPIEESKTNALGMRIAAAKVARGEGNYMSKYFETQVDFE